MPSLADDPGSFRFTCLARFVCFRHIIRKKEPALQFPLERPGPDTDRVEMSAGLSVNPDLHKSLTMRMHSPPHDMRDEVEGNVPLDIWRSPGHQDLVLRVRMITAGSPGI